MNPREMKLHGSGTVGAVGVWRIGQRHATEELLLRGSGADVVQMALLQAIL